MIEGVIFDWVGTLSEGSCKLFAYSERVLQECKSKGYKLGLISLAGHGVEQRLDDFKKTEVIKYFDSVKVNVNKTTKQFLECMQEMGTIPKTTLIVDDRTVRGIMIGNQLGCKTAWVKNGKYANETPTKETGEPTYIINSIEDLLDIL